MTNVLIIDANNMAFRSAHKLALTDPNGKDVGVVYGFLKTLQTLIRKHKPAHVIACWDGGVPEYRRQMLPSYKANRVRDESQEQIDFFEAVFAQMDLLHREFLPACGILSVKRIGIEADDLMYQAAYMLHDKMTCVIVSSDADLYQTTRLDNVVIHNPNKENILTREDILEEYGLSDILQYVPMRALIGDSSDNIKGAVGIGSVTAKKLFSEYKSVVAMMNVAESDQLRAEHKMSAKLAEKLLSFGIGGFTVNFYVMLLHFDRSGSRHQLINTEYQPYSLKTLKKLLDRHGFLSLKDHEFYSCFLKLSAPNFTTTNVRIPLKYTRMRNYGK